MNKFNLNLIELIHAINWARSNIAVAAVAPSSENIFCSHASIIIIGIRTIL